MSKPERTGGAKIKLIVNLGPKEGSYKCDFCSSTDVKWRYPTWDFQLLAETTTLDKLEARSIADWFACEPCGVLIDQEDLKGLVDRAHTAYCNSNTVPEDHKPKLKNLVTQLYLEFFKYRRRERKEDARRK